jgi:hypothetical protein
MLVPPVGLGLAAAPAAARPAAARACAGWRVVPSQSRDSATLNAVAASRRDAWAVGSYDTGSGPRTLIERWTGSRWRIVPSRDPATGTRATDTLGGVAVISRSNAWAVGFYEKRTTSFRTLIEHWNGTRWSVVPSPNQGAGENTLAAIAVRSASDIWAAGYRQNASGQSFSARRTLIEHWNGRRWSIVPSPSVGSGDNFLFGVAAVSKARAWAVGSDSVSFGRTLALSWNGSAWSVVPTRNRGQGDRFLQGVAAPSAGFALAVGSDLNGNQVQTLAQRWQGGRWSIAPSPSPGRDYNSLQAVAAADAGNAWAVGTRRNAQGAPFRTLAEHWNGRAWTLAQPPSPGHGDHWLYGVAHVPGGGWWAVGTAGGAPLAEAHC